MNKSDFHTYIQNQKQINGKERIKYINGALRERHER